MLFVLLLLIIFVSVGSSVQQYEENSADTTTKPWLLPVFPEKMPAVNRSMDKLIPRYLWMAVKEIEEQMNYQLPALFARNKNWKINIVDNHNKDIFMNEVSKYLHSFIHSFILFLVTIVTNINTNYLYRHLRIQVCFGHIMRLVPLLEPPKQIFGDTLCCILMVDFILMMTVI